MIPRSACAVRCGVALLALLAVGAPTAAEQVVLEPTKDNTIFSESSSLSNGVGVSIFAGRTGTGARRRALLAFDVAGAIPAGATITSAQLQLRMTLSIAGVEPVTIHRLNADWGEGMSNSTVMGGGMGAPATTADATWGFRFFNTQEWTTDGGDFVATASATQNVGNQVTFYTWGSTPTMVADVQAWLDAPNTNFGWIVRGDETETSTAKRFASGDGSAANRPKLTIDFEPPVSVPTATPTATLSPPSATETATTTAETTSTITVTVAATSTATVVVASPTASETVLATETPTVTTPSATPTGVACVGDCDGNGDVGINELILGVNIALGVQPLDACPAFDPSGSGQVEISELISAVNNALEGCQ